MFLGANRELVGVRPLHLAFARPLCLLERPTGAIHCFRNRKTFQRLLVLFKGFVLRLQKSFFCLSAWRSHIVPHSRGFGKPFFKVFCAFFAFVYRSQFFAPNFRVFGQVCPFFPIIKGLPYKHHAQQPLVFSSFLPASSAAGSARRPRPALAACQSDQWASGPTPYNRKLPPGR